MSPGRGRLCHRRQPEHATREELVNVLVNFLPDFARGYIYVVLVRVFFRTPQKKAAKVLTTTKKFSKLFSAMGTIKIDKKTGFAYIPKELRDDGFEGEVDTIADALTVTLIKPGVPMDRTIRSLEIVLQDLKLRVEHEDEQNKEKP